jgi:dTDP-4-dehydrorhamnose reductase
VNARAVKRLAQRCAEADAKLVHLSTNYVFDGTADEPYAEHDRPNPRSIYAISKLAGEYCALSYAPGAIVARGAGLYGLHGSASKGGNFVQRMIARAEEQGWLKVVDDQLLSPTYTEDLAAAMIEAVECAATGVVHLTASGACSWHEFTAAILELAGVDADLQAIQTEAVAPHRPLNGVLARPRADRLGLTPLRQWRDALEGYLEYSNGSSSATSRSRGAVASR